MLRVLPLIAPGSLPIAAISPVRTQTEASFFVTITYRSIPLHDLIGPRA